MVTVRAGQDTAGARLSHSDMCTAGSGLFTEWLTRNITAWLAWPSAGVNQNSSEHPVRRYRTTGLNGPAEAAIAANVSYLVRAPSVACVRRNSGLLQKGVRTGIRTLSPTRTNPPVIIPAVNQPRWAAAAASARTRASAVPAANSRAPRATERQVTESAAVSAVAPHRIQLQPPGTRLTSTYPSRAQNTAPRTAMLAPPTAGYAPRQTSTPAAHSTPPAAQVRCLHRCRGIRSARLMAVVSSRPRAARCSLPAPATARVAPQLTAKPAVTDAIT